MLWDAFLSFVCLKARLAIFDDRLDGIWHLIPGRKGLPPKCEA